MPDARKHHWWINMFFGNFCNACNFHGCQNAATFSDIVGVIAFKFYHETKLIDAIRSSFAKKFHFWVKMLFKKTPTLSKWCGSFSVHYCKLFHVSLLQCVLWRYSTVGNSSLYISKEYVSGKYKRQTEVSENRHFYWRTWWDYIFRALFHVVSFCVKLIHTRKQGFN